MTNVLPTSADTGNPLDLSNHATGNPIPSGASGEITVGHTVVIIFGALGLLWLLGAFTFRSVRM